MDSREATLEHISVVQRLLKLVIENLFNRAEVHDESKLFSPEVEIFDEVTPKLAALTYGSPEYNDMLKQMGVGLEHHYKYNSHHPEHYKDGIKGMSLLDLIEMICDWKAATLRHKNGDLLRSIEQNQQRFGYSDELKQIFLNTVNELRL
jgi:Family of unknown function (DUF5662)